MPAEALAKAGGESWIRTSEGIADGFTVHPLWPLGNLAASQAYSTSLFNYNIVFFNRFQLNFIKFCIFFKKNVFLPHLIELFLFYLNKSIPIVIFFKVIIIKDKQKLSFFTKRTNNVNKP